MTSSSFHLPLNDVDLKNQPPLYYLWVQDGLILVTGILWTVTYVLYIHQARQDKSYGMPIIALCANMAWEFIYGIFFPLSVSETLTFVPWIAIDLGIIWQTLRFGPGEWKTSPLVSKNLGLLLVTGVAIMLWLHWAFIKTCPNVDYAAFWAGFACQALLGWASVIQLISRNSTKGHSWTIWLCRWIGSTSALCMFQWRFYHYPEDYYSVGTPLATFLFISFELADLTYPFVYAKLSSQEKALREGGHVQEKSFGTSKNKSR